MKPDWNKAPGWANYLAQDGDGCWHWYAAQPAAMRGTADWSSEGVKMPVDSDCRETYTPNPNWELTLERIPVKGQLPQKPVPSEPPPGAVPPVVPCSTWAHRNGIRYRVLGLFNEHSEYRNKYPVIVTYEGDNGRTWARPLDDWHRSFTLVADPPPNPMHFTDAEVDRMLADRPDERYLRLAAVLDLAYAQAARGKGAERHAGGQAFDEQPMQQISRLLGSADGMAFQAIKKVREALSLPTPERQVAELLGAINYIAGIVIYIEDNAEAEA